MQSWCKIWQLNGFNLIRAKPRLLRRQKRAYKSSWSRRGTQKSLTQTIPWNSAKPLKVFPGIVVRQLLTVQRQNGIAERAMRRVKEGTSAVLLQSGLDEKWWADSMECDCNLRNIQHLLSDGKTLYERRFIQRTNNSVWFDGRIPPYFCKRLVATASISSAQKSYWGYSSVVCDAREESGKETSWSRTLRNWTRWTHLKIRAKRLNAKEVLTPKHGI